MNFLEQDLSTAETKQHSEVGHENDVGYLKKSEEKGGDGYQHFESFHNKDGDSYGYEKHEAVGKSNKGESTDGKKGKQFLSAIHVRGRTRWEPN